MEIFKFIFENQEYIEQEKQETLTKGKIIPELNAFVGRIFEDVALSEMIKNNKFKDYIFGRWWDKKEEVDIVGIDRKNKNILIGEVKFKNITKSDINEIKNKLKRLSKKINAFNYREELVIFCLDCDIEDNEIGIIKLGH